jgi:hypothetical protein
VIAAVIVAIVCSWLPSIQTLANEHVNDGLKRALVSFAAAKTLNAAISVAQGTEIAVQPLGVGVTLTLGQVLDPLNDLVEQFASLMLTAAVAFGVQKVLLAMGAYWVISLAVTAVAVAWAALYLQDRAPQWLSRLLVVLLMVRFAIPVVTIGSDWAFQAFLASKYEQAQTSLVGVAGEAAKSAIKIAEKGNKEVTVPAQANNGQAAAKVEQNNKEGGLLEKAKQRLGLGTDKPASSVEGQSNNEGGWLDGFKQKLAGLDVAGKLNALRRAVDKATDHIIDLMVVFLLQTIIIPLLLLWALSKVAGGLFLARPDPLKPDKSVS